MAFERLPFRIKFVTPLPVLLIASLLGGCSGQPTTPEPTPEQACATLKTILSHADNGFVEIRTRQIISPMADIWESKNIFPDSNRCQVWQWGKGRVNYACLWDQNSAAEAKAVYDKYRPIVAACLGKSWQANEVQTTSGYQTLFRKGNDPVGVSMRYFNDHRSLKKKWWTSLIIGSEMKVHDPLQRYSED